MGLLGRLTGWDSLKEVYNILLAGDLWDVSSAETRAEITDVVMRAMMDVERLPSAEAALDKISEETRSIQLQFVALACRHLGLSPRVRGIEFFQVNNPYWARDCATDLRVGVVVSTLRDKYGFMVRWPGDDVRINFRPASLRANAPSADPQRVPDPAAVRVFHRTADVIYTRVQTRSEEILGDPRIAAEMETDFQNSKEAVETLGSARAIENGVMEIALGATALNAKVSGNTGAAFTGQLNSFAYLRRIVFGLAPGIAFQSGETGPTTVSLVKLIAHVLGEHPASPCIDGFVASFKAFAETLEREHLIDAASTASPRVSGSIAATPEVVSLHYDSAAAIASLTAAARRHAPQLLRILGEDEPSEEQRLLAVFALYAAMEIILRPLKRHPAAVCEAVFANLCDDFSDVRVDHGLVFGPVFNRQNATNEAEDPVRDPHSRVMAGDVAFAHLREQWQTEVANHASKVRGPFGSKEPAAEIMCQMLLGRDDRKRDLKAGQVLDLVRAYYQVVCFF